MSTPLAKPHESVHPPEFPEQSDPLRPRARLGARQLGQLHRRTHKTGVRVRLLKGAVDDLAQERELSAFQVLLAQRLRARPL